MKKLALTLFLIVLSIQVYADTRLGIEFQYCESIKSSQSHFNLNSNFGISGDWTKNRFGVSSSFYYKPLPYTSIEEIPAVMVTDYYSIIDIQISPKIYLFKTDRKLNPFVSAAIVHRFILTPKDIDYETVDTALKTLLGLDFRFERFSLLLQGGIIPVKYMKSNEFLLLPDDFDSVISLAFLYNFK